MGRLPKLLAFVLGIALCVLTVLGPAPARAEARITLLEFTEVCGGVDEVNSLVSRATGLGWEAMNNDDVAFLARRIAEFETSMLASIGGWREAISTFRKNVSGKQLFLLVEDHRTPETANLMRMNTCEVFDFADPPTYDQAVEIFGTTHSAKDDRYPPNKDFTKGFGVAWNDEFGLRGASTTKIWTWSDEEEGQYVVYSAQRQFWKPASSRKVGDVPPIPPPPIQFDTPDTKSDADTSLND